MEYVSHASYHRGELVFRSRSNGVGDSALIVVGKFVGPHLRAMKHTQDANGIAIDQVGRDIGRARDDQLARAGDTPGSAAFGKVEQAPRSIGNLFVNMNRGTRILGFNVAENTVAIRQRVPRPDELHRFCSAAF